MVKNPITVIIQARYSSKRFEGKILKKIENKTILEILIKRLKRSKKIDNIIVACSNNVKDKKIINLCKRLNIGYFDGSEKNVQKRFYKASKKFKITNIVRITSDCPLIDVSILDKMIIKFKEGYDYVSNTIDPTMPDGFDIEIFKTQVLKERLFTKKINNEIEHVTSGIKKNSKYKAYNFRLKKNYSNLRLTLDTKYDLKIIKKLLKYFNNNIYIGLDKILKLYKKNSRFFEKNADIPRHEEYEANIGQKYWIRAQEIISGGSMLFSKNPDLHLPKLWPAYFSKSKGCQIWGLDGKRYIDFHLMGVGTNTLGYANKELEKNIILNLSKGNMTTLNSIDEIELAEKLIRIHPWAEMARFTRTGGEANSVAIRIARAYSNKDNIAICGYHGWHDWYLSSNLQNPENLNKHLMSNLKIKGVPKKLKDTVFSFEYNNFEQLKKIVETKNIGTIKMEVERNDKPKNNFLQKVRNLANKKNIILIFDECTSGFRSNLGGLHLKYKVNPDMLILGKALGNGHAINAIIGKKDLMSASNTFISSTFWTERIGAVAANKTLEIMEKLKSWEIISKIGVDVKQIWKSLSKLHGIKIRVQGLNAIPNFYFHSENNNFYKTYISQEMIKKNFLASNIVFACINHNQNILKEYMNNMDKIFKKIKDCENEREDIHNILNVPVSLKGFRSDNFRNNKSLAR